MGNWLYQLKLKCSFITQYVFEFCFMDYAYFHIQMGFSQEKKKHQKTINKTRRYKIRNKRIRGEQSSLRNIVVDR